MPFIARVELVDAYGRKGSKQVHLDAVDGLTLASSQAAMAAWVPLFRELTGMGITAISYTARDIALAVAPVAAANKDGGATFRVRMADNYIETFKIPAFILGLVDPAGNIDVALVEVGDFFAQYQAGGVATYSDGELIAEVVSGTLDV